MSSLQPWFERTFTFDLPNASFPRILERLRDSPAQLRDCVRDVPLARMVVRLDDSWSISENIGHLGDLEPLWTLRARQLLEGSTELAVADLGNRVTHEANHNSFPPAELLERFQDLRGSFVSVLERASVSVLNRTARHPRLGTPMRLIDVAFFVAEHDDHHVARIRELLRLVPS